MASTRSLYAENLNLRWLLVSIALVAVGVTMLWVPFNPWVPLDENTVGRALAFGVGSALVAAGVIGTGYELGLRRAQVKETLDLAGLSSDLARTGVVRVALFADIDWMEYFDENGGDVDVCFSYGRTWSTTIADRLLRSVADTDRRVRITVLDPEPPMADEVLLDAYAHRYRLGDTDEIRLRILDSVEVWRKTADIIEREGKKVNLALEAIRAMMPYTFYRSGNAMWVVFAQRQPERVGGRLPSILCARTGDQKHGLYDWVMDDIEACRRSSVTRLL